MTLIQFLDLNEYMRLVEEVEAAKAQLDTQLKDCRHEPETRRALWKEFLFQWSPTLLVLANSERAWRTTHKSRANLYQWIAMQRQLEEAA